TRHHRAQAPRHYALADQAVSIETDVRAAQALFLMRQSDRDASPPQHPASEVFHQTLATVNQEQHQMLQHWAWLEKSPRAPEAGQPGRLPVEDPLRHIQFFYQLQTSW